MTSHYRRSKLAVVLGNYAVGITATSPETCTMHHRMLHARIVRNNQFVIRFLMQELEENKVPRIASAIDPR